MLEEETQLDLALVFLIEVKSPGKHFCTLTFLSLALVLNSQIEQIETMRTLYFDGQLLSLKGNSDVTGPDIGANILRFEIN